MRLLDFALLVWMAVACSDPLSGQQRALDSNREAWQAQDIEDYAYTLQITCFCPPEITNPVIVQVAADSIISVVVASTGAAVASSLVQNFYTVDDLFYVIQHAIDSAAHELSVTYDPELHYPTKIVIDYDERAVDEELALAASGLQPGG